ncbi:MAG: imidazole glycerol phosphate synthase subunit HisH [Desulfobacteraceae bacterium]|nr:imidazole glycerol phosphate synthase subunit HisH [Desulfobacteraceae bacterium]
MIVIIDYGLCNLRSVQKAFERLHIEACVSNDATVIEKGEKLVLPGVGHFAAGMKSLRGRGLIEVLNRRVVGDKAPILGICLGMQLMTNCSEDGDCVGLGWIDAATRRFKPNEFVRKLKIPHMGWNNIARTREDALLKGIADSAMFYFVHSYRVMCENASDVLARTTYGVEFDSAFRKDNIWGVQFHPEKSHQAGLKLLGNFSSLQDLSRRVR